MFTLLWTVEKELELNLYIMQAQFDNKSSLSGYNLGTSAWWSLMEVDSWKEDCPKFQNL